MRKVTKMQKTTRRAALVLAAAITGGVVMTATAQAASSPAGPPPPPWVQTNGQLRAERSMAPLQVPVVGPDGNLVTDAAGKAKTVPLRIGEMPPPPGSTAK
jgi:hypothetical protein